MADNKDTRSALSCFTIHDALDEVREGVWDAYDDAVSGAAFGYLVGKGLELNVENYNLALVELGITEG